MEMKNIRNFCIIAHIALDGEIVGNWHPSAKDGGISIFKDFEIVLQFCKIYFINL